MSTAMTPKGDSLIKRWYGPLFTSKVWLQTFHLLLDLPIGIAAFTISITLLSLSGGLVITLIGIPLLGGTVILGRQIASFERSRSQIFLDDNPPEPEKFNLQVSPWAMLKNALKDIHGWKGLVYGIILMPLGIVNFTLIVIFWTLALSLPLVVFTYWFASNANSGIVFGFASGRWELGALGHPSGRVAFGIALSTTVAGFLLLALVPRIVNGLAWLDRILIRALCSPNVKEFLNQRVNALEESRTASVEGAATELRRIERDLHDGAQQHLVSVAMQLGMAKERMGEETDPALADLVTSAHKDAKQAIVELRDLVRGIHPAVLTDRGLDAAVSALAARLPIPVEVTFELQKQLHSVVEATAYFVISESLTNIAKHSQATQATVHLTEENHRVVIEVTDNGVGGAHNVVDGGLSGLRDRVRSIEGDMTISSPVNGPTKIVVNLPCA
ncbi:MAG: sensor histidine kinase [Actinobacteria bacterium]|nr:sensor histidine kinase [Actinomycetota bacterium]